jgi:hypothetical protein
MIASRSPETGIASGPARGVLPVVCVALFQLAPSLIVREQFKSRNCCVFLSLSHARAHEFCIFICSYEIILFDGDVVQCASLVSLRLILKNGFLLPSKMSIDFRSILLQSSLVIRFKRSVLRNFIFIFQMKMTSFKIGFYVPSMSPSICNSLGFFFLLGFFYSWCYKITMRRQKKRLRRCKATNRRRRKKKKIIVMS